MTGHTGGDPDYCPGCRADPPHFPQCPGPQEEPVNDASTAPHSWAPRKWRFWICRHCYGPKRLHPRTGWVKARPLGDNRYLSPDAPHFTRSW